MGPILLFDKSFIEMLNVDEAALFDFLFSSNICPMFLTEVLADLERERPGERTCERVVGDVALKTPSAHSYPNMHHANICMGELLGHPVEMSRRPVVGGGRPVRVEGKTGVYYENSPEMEAYHRWQGGRFREVERDFAWLWRKHLAEADLRGAARIAHAVLAIRDAPKNLAEAMEIAQAAVMGPNNRYRIFKAAYCLLSLDPNRWLEILRRWKQAGGPPLSEYAPYVAHCLLVDVFFHVAVTKGLISPDRVSNRVDIAYFYYLPFAMGFVSNDKLHKRVVPLLLREDQLFVDGAELKQDLQKLDAHFSALPEEVRKQGLFRFAKPPNDDSFLTTRLYKQFGIRVDEEEIKLTPKQHNRVSDEVLGMVKKMEQEAKNPTSNVQWEQVADPDNLTIERKLSLRRGKWQIMSDDAAAKATVDE